MTRTPTLDPRGLASVLALARTRLHEGLSVPDLADHAGYSPFHFSRLFAASVGISPGAYLTALRIEQAKHLLLAGDDPVIDIATAVGFDSLSSFGRRFRATVGVPPGELRVLADRVADRPARPFRLVDDRAPGVRITVELPGGEPSETVSLWFGWYAQPAPIGLPAAGVLTEYGEPVVLPLTPGAPWLLAFAVPAGSGVVDQLAPVRPLVAGHPAPLTSAGTVTLRFRYGGPEGIPLLSALPSLCRR